MPYRGDAASAWRRKLEQPSGLDWSAGGVHVGDRHAEVGLVDAELPLDGLAGEADLATRDDAARGNASLCELLLDGVRGLHVGRADEIAHRPAGDEALLCCL